MTLDEVRESIDRVDRQMKELFQERMELVDHVASVKAENGDVILKPDREKAMIERLSGDVSPEIKMEYRAFLKKMIEISRKYQYGKILELGKEEKFSWKTENPDLIVHPEDNRIKIVVGCSLKDGTPALLFSVISYFEIEITEMYSGLVPEKKGICEFSLELAGNLQDKKVQALFYQLSSETEYFRILGSYKCEGDSRE